MNKLTVILVLLLTSCELIVDVKVPYGKDKLVMNGVQSTDSVWTVELTRSNSILAPYSFFFPVDLATVIITKPDGSTEQLKLEKGGTGRFKGTSYAETGKTYRVLVSSPGLDPVEAELTMPTPVKIVSIKWDSSDIRPLNGANDFVSFNLPFEVTFSDPPVEKNFYAIELFATRVRSYKDPGTDSIYSDTTFEELRPRIDDPGIASKNDGRQWFPDTIIEGKTYTAPMNVQIFNYSDGEIIELHVRLVSMSEEYFRYMETMDLSFEVEGDPFSQPVQIYSNTTNGFGIFAGVAYDVKKYNNN
jgi:hypothetical protein